jgi:hypothetical protein
VLDLCAEPSTAFVLIVAARHDPTKALILTAPVI